MLVVPRPSRNNTKPKVKATAFTGVMEDMEGRAPSDKTVSEDTILVRPREYGSSVRTELVVPHTYVPLTGIKLQDPGVDGVFVGTLAPMDTESVVTGSDTGLMATEHMVPYFPNGQLATMNREVKMIRAGQRLVWAAAPMKPDTDLARTIYESEHPNARRVTFYPVSMLNWSAIPERQLAQFVYNTHNFVADAKELIVCITPYLASMGAIGVVPNLSDVQIRDYTTLVARGLADYLHDRNLDIQDPAGNEIKALDDINHDCFVVVLNNAFRRLEKNYKWLADEIKLWNGFVEQYTQGDAAGKIDMMRKLWAVTCTIRERRLIARSLRMTPWGGELLFVPHQ